MKSVDNLLRELYRGRAEVYFTDYMNNIPQRKNLHRLTGMGSYLEDFRFWYFNKNEWTYIKNLIKFFLETVDTKKLIGASENKQSALKRLERDFEAYLGMSECKVISMEELFH